MDRRNFGSTLKWSVDIQDGVGRGRFPGKRGFYYIAVQLLVVKNIFDTKLLHVTTEPATTVSPTYLEYVSGEEEEVIITLLPKHAIRSFIVRDVDKPGGVVTEDCNEDLFFSTIDLNSTDIMELNLIGDDSELLWQSSGKCLLIMDCKV